MTMDISRGAWKCDIDLRTCFHLAGTRAEEGKTTDIGSRAYTGRTTIGNPRQPVYCDAGNDGAGARCARTATVAPHDSTEHGDAANAAVPLLFIAALLLPVALRIFPFRRLNRERSTGAPEA